MQNNNNKNKHNVNIMSNTELGLSTNNNNIKYNQHIITNNKCLLTITIIEMRWSVEYDYRGCRYSTKNCQLVKHSIDC